MCCVRFTNLQKIVDLETGFMEQVVEYKEFE